MTKQYLVWQDLQALKIWNKGLPYAKKLISTPPHRVFNFLKFKEKHSVLKAGVYNLGDMKVASPPNSSPLCSVRRHAPSPLSLLSTHLLPQKEQADHKQRVSFERGVTSVGVTGMTNCKVIRMHVETNVALIAHYNVHSCQANVSVLALLRQRYECHVTTM